MESDGAIRATYENGMLHLDRALDLPERSRLVMDIRRVETTPESEAAGKEMMEAIRRRGLIRLNGWRPSRDEVHERR